MKERSLLLRQRRIAADLCFRCGSKASIRPATRQPKHADKGLLCEYCYFKGKAKQYLGSSYWWKTLKAKWEEQDGRCPYTGEPMILGETASVDHIYPVSRFPEMANDPSNLEWVPDQINKMKQDLTKDEFISLVRVMAARFPA